MRERIMIEHQFPYEKPSSMEEIIKFLKSNEFNTKNHYYEFEISDEIKPNHIRMLLTLPYEVALSEQNGKVILSTGGSEDIGREQKLVDRMHHSKLSFHTHPIEADKKTVNTPSFSDIYATEYTDSTTPLLLACEEGIMLYRKPKPIKDPEAGIETEEANSIMWIYGDKLGIDLLGGGDDKSMRQWSDISPAEQIAIQRKFAEDMGVIILEAKWEDTEKVREIMKYINLQKT